MGIFSSTSRWRHTRPALAGVAALCLAGGISLTVGTGPGAADTAISVAPSSGPSATKVITITIPQGATCSGDHSGGNNQYQIYPYIISASESPQSIRYTGGSIRTLSWFTDDAADTYTPYAPGVGNHGVSQPANVDWSPYQTNGDWNVTGADLQPGTYNVGVTCIDVNPANNPSGAPDMPGNGDPTQDGHENFWNTQFTFTPVSGKSTDFTWTADTNSGSSSTTTTTTTIKSGTTTTTLADNSSTTTVAGGATTTTTTASHTGTTTTLVAGTAATGGSGSAGSAGSGSGPSSDASSPTSDAPSSQLAATGARDLPEQVLLGASLAFGGLFLLSFAYPTRRQRSTLGRRG